MLKATSWVLCIKMLMVFFVTYLHNPNSNSRNKIKYLILAYLYMIPQLGYMYNSSANPIQFGQLIYLMNI